MGGEWYKRIQIRMFWDRAAVYSIVAPILAPVIGFPAIYVFREPLSKGPAALILNVVFFVAVGSFFLGTASLLSAKRHERRMSVWLAVCGIIISGMVGYLTLVFLYFSVGLTKY